MGSLLNNGSLSFGSGLMTGGLTEILGLTSTDLTLELPSPPCYGIDIGVETPSKRCNIVNTGHSFSDKCLCIVMEIMGSRVLMISESKPLTSEIQPRVIAFSARKSLTYF